MDDADRGVQVALGDGEAREAGLDGDGDQVGHRVGRFQRFDLGAWGHEFLGGATAEPQRPIDQHRRGFIEGAAACRCAHQRPQFLRRAR
ncbi:Uncharacterised protein [Mycobacteroides abscessus subsp. massiliense]|nr:Uncharacterised protein [Mycobacteroides abscessus subsp. massiliense]